jgi:hypothetical protein
MSDASLWRWIRILAIVLAACYAGVGIIGGIAIDFDGTGDRLFWMLFLLVGAAMLLLGVGAADRSRWLAVGAMAAGGLLGSLALFWAILPPLATLVLVVLGVLWARRPAEPATA